MANTYIPISSATVGAGGAAFIDFVNIPQIYTDLVLKITTRSAQTGGGGRRVQLRFNGATTDADLTFLRVYGAGTISGADSGSTGHTAWMPDAAATANFFSNIEVYIPNYTISSNKSFGADGVQENNAVDAAYMGFFANRWASSAAITAIRIFEVDGFNLVQNSSATLYGIKNTV